MHHELTTWSRGNIIEPAHRGGYSAVNGGRPVTLHGRRLISPVHVQRPATGGLAKQDRFGRTLPEYVAIMQIGPNKKWEQIGMDVPERLRELEEPER